MKINPLILLTAILSMVVIPIQVKADSPAPIPAGCIREPQDYIGAVTLGQMAYQGMFQSQGIPSAGGLIEAYSAGNVTSKSIVQAAIKSCILSKDYQLDQNQGYLNDLDQELRSLSRNN
jgi:hypothetical protein